MSKGLARLLGGWSREQLGITLLLGCCLLGVLVWRATPPASPPDAPRPLWFIEVAGEAPRPGVYPFETAPTLAAVLARAGWQGTIPEAGAASLASGTKVTVAAGGAVSLGRMTGQELLTLGLLVDVNAASAADLAAVPGIGPALAARIVDYRQEHGEFRKMEDLLEVKGVGEKSLDNLRPFLMMPADNISEEQTNP